MKISIISASVRIDRKSHRVALFLKNYLEDNMLATVALLDLNEYRFPVFEERLRNMKEPTRSILNFAGEINHADGVIIVTPEYNGGYPASLKNVIDLLNAEWKRKPVALVTVSMGPFAGIQATTSLVFTLWKLGAWLVPAAFFVPAVQEAYDESGLPKDETGTKKRASAFIGELLWSMEAIKNMNAIKS